MRGGICGASPFLWTVTNNPGVLFSPDHPAVAVFPPGGVNGASEYPWQDGKIPEIYE
jgi:hypothetical protein